MSVDLRVADVEDAERRAHRENLLRDVREEREQMTRADLREGALLWEEGPDAWVFSVARRTAASP